MPDLPPLTPGKFFFKFVDTSRNVDCRMLEFQNVQNWAMSCNLLNPIKFERDYIEKSVGCQCECSCCSECENE